MIRYLRPSAIRRRRVLLRVDFNVPIRRGRAADEFDIVRVLPTVRALVAGRNTCILLSHHSDPHQSLRPLLPRLSRHLGRPVAFLAQPLLSAARRRVAIARPGTVFLAENVRFWPGEQANSVPFARALARLGDVFVNEAFGECHRPYASIIGIPRFLLSYAGPLLRAEMRMLDRFRFRPRRPFLGVLGGAKVSTKLPLLRRFLRRADGVLVGGAMANVLLRARGISVGRSRVDGGFPGLGALARSPRLLLPLDARVIKVGKRPHGRRTVLITGVASDEAIADIGPLTGRIFRDAIARARTVIWNGPLGRVEERPYAAGTRSLARSLLRPGLAVLIGGGDTVASLNRMRLLSRFKHISTGGGALLAYLAGEKLPGLEALKRRR